MRFFLLLFFLLFLGCGPSEESVNADWDEFVATHNACQTADDCVAVFPGCPLGCHSAVSKSAKSDADAEAADLTSSVADTCLYDCDVAPVLVCESNMCAFQK